MSLRILLDENSEADWFVNLLKESGYEVICLKDFQKKGLSDDAVLESAIHEGCVLYTRDRDFLRIAKSGAKHPGIIFEYRTNSPKDMSYAEIVAALSTLLKANENLENKIWIINNYRY